MHESQKRILIDTLLIVFAALNFGLWVESFNAGVFVGCVLSLMMSWDRLRI